MQLHMCTRIMTSNQRFVVYKLYLKGTAMHVDPDSTDAFNALFRGHKWWVYFPSDIYEFDEELSCDESCSEFDDYEGISNPKIKDSLMGTQRNALWFAHVLPQIRYMSLPYSKSYWWDIMQIEPTL